MTAFRSLCARMRALWPLDQKVRIRRWRFSPQATKRWGIAWSYENERGYVIAIDSRLDWEATVDALMHEWCHLYLDDDTGQPTHEHGDDFWILYGSMYRAFHREK